MWKKLRCNLLIIFKFSNLGASECREASMPGSRVAPGMRSSCVSNRFLFCGITFSWNRPSVSTSVVSCASDYSRFTVSSDNAGSVCERKLESSLRSQRWLLVHCSDFSVNSVLVKWRLQNLVEVAEVASSQERGVQLMAPSSDTRGFGKMFCCNSSGTHFRWVYA